MATSEIRKDYIQDRYVIIAPKRGKRPHDVEKTSRAQAITKQACVFCPEKIDAENKVLYTSKKTKQKGEPWAVKVIANKFPSVSITNPKAYGRQEVIIDTPDHRRELEELPLARIVEIINVYAQRTREISKDKKIDYIITFKNEGGAAGASLQHSHSQIFATEFLPPHIKDKSERVHAYQLQHGSCVYCDVIKKESGGPRWVTADKHIVAFCPWASMHNYEIWLMPRRHIDNIAQLTKNERVSFAKILKKTLIRLNDLGLPYNYYFHQTIHDTDQHFYMKIKPRGSVWAGVELGSGLIINPVAPEDAAAFYRQ